MSGLTFTLEPNFYGDFSVNNLASRNFCLVHGYFTYDSASCSYVAFDADDVGLNKIQGFVASPKGGVFWTFDPANVRLQPVAGAYYSATGMCYFTSTASLDVASITSVAFLCWGFR